MKYTISILFTFVCFSAFPQSIRIPLHELEEAGDSGYIIRANALGDAEWYEITEYNGDTVIVWNPLTRKFGFIKKDSISTPLPDSLAYGTGTTNYLSRWIAPFTLGTAGISDDGSEIQFARPTVLYGVNTAAPATYGTFGIDNTLGIERPTYYNGSAWVPWLSYSGGTNQYSYFSNSNTITSGTQLYRDANGVSIGDGNYFRLPSNSTVGSMLTAAGHTEFNTTAQNFSFRTSTSTEYPVKSSTSTGLLTQNYGVTANSTGRLQSISTIRFANNNLGINVSPASTTRVQIDDGSIPNTGTYYIFQSAGRYTNALTQTGTLYGYFTAVQRSSGAGSMSNVFGYYATVTDVNTTGIISGAVGGRFDVTTSAAMTSPISSQGSLTTNPTGTFGTARSFYATLTNNGTTTLYRGLDVETPTGSGTITTAQGIRIGSFTGTNRHAIYVEGGNSYHAGNFGIGSGNTSPSATLDIAGDLEVSTRTGTATALGGWSSDNKAVNVMLGSNLSITSGTLTVTGSYTGFTPAADSGTGSNVASGGTLTQTGGYGINTSVSGTTVTIEADTSELATQYDVAQAQDGNGIYSGSDSLSQSVTYAKMTSDIAGSTDDQRFKLGYITGNLNADGYGILLESPFHGDFGLIWNNVYGTGVKNKLQISGSPVFSRTESTGGSNLTFSTGGGVQLSGTNTSGIANIVVTSTSLGVGRSIRLDTFGLSYFLNATRLYSFVKNVSPSATSGLKSTMTWTGDGSTTTPSFTIPTFFTQTANGSVTNDTTETTVTASGVGTLTIPANYLEAGRTIVIKGTGYITNNSSVTLRMRAKLGGTTIGDTQAQTLENLGAANENFHFEYTFTCRSTGASGTIIGQGLFRYCPATGGLVPCQEFDMVNTTTTTINTTTTNTIDVTAQWGAASTDNNIVMTNLIVEAKN